MRLLQRRHRRVPLPGRRVLLPRDEHPAPGGAPRHRGGHRHRPRRRADPRRRRASRCRSPRTTIERARPLDRGAASTPRTRPAASSCPRPARITKLRRPDGSGVRWDGGYETATRSASTTTTSSASSSCGARDRRRAIARMHPRASSEIEVEGVATTIPADLAILAPPRLRRRRALDEVGRGRRSTSPASRADAGAGAGRRRRRASRWSSATSTVEVNGKRFAVKLWVPERAAGRGRGRRRPARSREPRRRAAAAAAGGGSGTVDRADAGHDREGARRGRRGRRGRPGRRACSRR